MPLLTRQWNPLTAPQAMVMNKNGKIGGAPGGFRFHAGATISSFTRCAPSTGGAPPMNDATTRPTTIKPSALSSCRLLM